MLSNGIRILGLDISTKNTGWCIVDANEQPTLIDYGDIPRNKMSIQEALVNFEKELLNIVKRYKPKVISAEAPFVGSNRQTIEKLCYFHGIMLMISQKKKLPVTYYMVMTLKSKSLGKVTVKKSDGTKKTSDELKKEVQQKMIDVFGKESFAKEYNDDITDSISAAYTYILMDGKPLEKPKTKKQLEKERKKEEEKERKRIEREKKKAEKEKLKQAKKKKKR